MYQVLLKVHNFLRWVIILLALLAIVRSLVGVASRKFFTRTDKTVGIWLMTASHIMFLLGIYQWMRGELGLKLIERVGMGEVMKNSAMRFWAVEHFAGMLIAIILITIGRGVSRKNISDHAKHVRTFWFYFIALLIILISVPWPFREGIGRPWFPGI